jgi:prophage antirepressor-like protein
MLCVNEYGLNELIFASHKEEVVKFRWWVASEVLPAIRKHGMYAKDKLLDNPDLLLSIITKL